ncbi:MAG: hypothetical protein ACUVRH_07755 [Candidatus Bipolaricaulia bacterium]
MFLGFALLLVGVLLPLLMVIRLLESTFLLNFLAYSASLSGLIIGFSGVVQYIRGGVGRG